MRGPSWLQDSQMPPRSEAKVNDHLQLISSTGTQRRKKKHVTTQVVSEDKKVMAAIKKFGKLSCEVLFL